MTKSKRAAKSPGSSRRRGWPIVGIGLAMLAVIGVILVMYRRTPVVEKEHGNGEAVDLSAYAGSANCRECHQQQYQLWSGSHHALAERPVDPKLDGMAFQPPRQLGPETNRLVLFSEESGFYLSAPVANGNRETFPLTRVIGVDPLLQFLAPIDEGRYQVTEAAYDPHKNEWFNVFGDENRHPGEWGHWTGRGMNWNSMCASCHNTALRKRYDPVSDSYSTTMAEMGVSCESCHGPMKAHTQWQRENSGSSTPDPTLQNVVRANMMDACGSCHARRSDLTGNFEAGDNFHDHYALSIVDETELFFPDGQVHEEDYEWTSFLSSRMHLAGVRCSDCHEPHSGKTRLSGNALCMQCHETPVAPAPKIDPAAHGHHVMGQPGSQCVDCHMPQTTFMQRHPRRDHGFTIPDPLLTKEFGIPNACNRCHQDKDVDWALARVEEWYGERMERPSRQRARILAQARAGNVDVMNELVRLTRSESNALWRASATAFLRGWVARPEAQEALLEGVKDSSPLVRTMAARGLSVLAEAGYEDAQGALEDLLEDSARVVRIEAAWGLRSQIETNMTAFADLVHFLGYNADQPTGQYQLGLFAMSRGQTGEAVDHFKRAVEWDSHSAPLHEALAVSLSAQGNASGAVEHLRAAVRLAPDDPELRYRLGLSLNEANRLKEAVQVLHETTRLEPRHANAWYNLALGYAQLKQYDNALQAIERAEELNPETDRFPYARATILAQLGRVDDAREAAMKALAMNPNSPEIHQLLRALGPPGR